MTNVNNTAEARSKDQKAAASAADRLDAGVQALNVPEPLAEAETLLLKVGVALPVLGIVLILIAYWRSADTAFVADQIPMLISGGVLGLGLLMIGVGLFVRYSLTRLFRFWLARVIVEQQAQTDRVVAALDNVETAIRESRVGK